MPATRSIDSWKWRVRKIILYFSVVQALSEARKERHVFTGFCFLLQVIIVRGSLYTVGSLPCCSSMPFICVCIFAG